MNEKNNTYVYECKYKDNIWLSYIKNMENHDNYIRCVIEGRGSSILTFIGKESNKENWIFFPLHEKGCFLSNYDDFFWNLEKLTNLFENIIDGTTIATAITLFKAKKQELID